MVTVVTTYQRGSLGRDTCAAVGIGTILAATMCTGTAAAWPDGNRWYMDSNKTCYQAWGYDQVVHTISWWNHLHPRIAGHNDITSPRAGNWQYPKGAAPFWRIKISNKRLFVADPTGQVKAATRYRAPDSVLVHRCPTA